MYRLIIFLGAILLFSCATEKEGLNLQEETPETMLAKADAAYNAGNYDEAIMLNQALIDNFPMTDLHIDAQLNIAKALGAKEKFEEQFELLLRIMKENIIPERVPEIYIQIAEFYENAARWNPGVITDDSTDIVHAARYYRKAVFYPNSEDKAMKSKALYRAGLMYAKLHQVETAKRAYEQVIAYYPDSPYSQVAQIKLQDPANTDEVDMQTISAAPQETVTPEDQLQAPPPTTDQQQIGNLIQEDTQQNLNVPVGLDTTQVDLQSQPIDSTMSAPLDSM